MVVVETDVFGSQVTVSTDKVFKEDDSIKESRGNYGHKGPFWYFTTHGIGPGTIPNDVHVVDTKEGKNRKGTEGDFVALDGVLTADELKEYDLIELAPVDESMKEGISGKMTPEEIAKKHNVSIEEINKQLEKGIKVEKEHTDDEKKAERIALDHLFEIPDYYDRLDKMEKGALKEDTIKTSSGKWTNKGKEGTHGTFKTKKEADAQRKAMWANRKKGATWGEGLKESHDFIGNAMIVDELPKVGHKANEYGFGYKDSTIFNITLEEPEEGYDIYKVWCKDDIDDPTEEGYYYTMAIKKGGKQIKEDMKNQNKWEKLFDEYIDMIEFRLEKDKKGKFHLHDLQGANLGDIESDSFDNADEVLDRLGVYHEDYIIRDIEDLLYEADVDLSSWDGSYEDLLKFRDKLPDYQFDFDVLDMIVNHGKDIDLENVYYEETDYDYGDDSSEWEEVETKSVKDSNGFTTDYTWYTNGKKHVFVFGDKDSYRPEDEDYDWEIEIEDGYEAEAQKEAKEWFDSYNGFADDVDESLKESVDKKTYEVEKWWEDVQDWNVRNGSPFMIDNGNPEDEGYFDSMVDAMFDMVRDLKDKDEELYKRGKRLYNKYAKYSKITESEDIVDTASKLSHEIPLKSLKDHSSLTGVQTYTVKDNSPRGVVTKSVDDIKVGDEVVLNNHFVRVTESVDDEEILDGKYVYVLTDGKDNIIEQFDDFDEAVAYAQNSDVVEYIEEVYMDEDGEIDWDDAGIAWERDEIVDECLNEATEEQAKEIISLAKEIGIEPKDFVRFKKEHNVGTSSEDFIKALKDYKKELGDDFKIEESKINIRESLNKIDNDTYNQFDLRNLYDGQQLTEEKKITVAKLIKENASAETIYKVLMEAFEDEEEVDIRTIERDTARTGNAFFSRKPTSLEDIRTAKEKRIEIDPDSIGDDYRVVKSLEIDKNISSLGELNSFAEKYTDETITPDGKSYYDRNVIEVKTPEGRWLIDTQGYDYARYVAFVGEE